MSIMQADPPNQARGPTASRARRGGLFGLARRRRHPLVKRADTYGHGMDETRRSFILSVVQPGLAGLMDGSISSLAPIFAAAFACHKSHVAFLVGVATAVGAGVSMAFSEGLSDDGKVSGRGSSWVRGPVCGVMTFLGAAGHTLPFLIPSFVTAMALATGVVCVELLLIAWIRRRYMDTPLGAAIFQVVVGGAIVLVLGILIGIWDPTVCKAGL